ncbi:MAG: hypothetical protein BWX96_01753 [Bacteroidetes bacterium ADurb.Bin145]|nr:MAG: hypothetical protein BWX96_01753 [Bacteroidetes bacterium ADurb.Bin145]
MQNFYFAENIFPGFKYPESHFKQQQRFTAFIIEVMVLTNKISHPGIQFLNV